MPERTTDPTQASYKKVTVVVEDLATGTEQTLIMPKVSDLNVEWLSHDEDLNSLPKRLPPTPPPPPRFSLTAQPNGDSETKVYAEFITRPEDTSQTAYDQR